MAVDQHRHSEIGVGARQQAAQAGMIGLVDRLDPRKRLVDRQPVGIDIHILGDDARHRSKTAGDPHGADIGIRRKRAFEHAGIELVGLAIDVQIGAREIRFEKRRADLRCRREQLVDEMIFGAANLVRIEPCRFQEGDGVAAAAMGEL